MCRLKVLALTLLVCGSAVAQEMTLRGKVEVAHKSRRKSGSSEVVVWLTGAHLAESSLVSLSPVRLVQKDRRFSPHVVAVRTGAEIEFPNQDPFFHDVFSIYRGKPFDLGLYESGTVRRVKFSQTGVSYIFCNIHPEMSAAVVAVPTPYFATTESDGSFQINHVPRGHYKMEFWYELASPTELSSLTQEIDIGLDTQPIAITLHSSDIPMQHLDKYGQEYATDKPKSY